MSDDVQGNGTAEAQRKKTRHRSPNYPAFGLRDAVEKIQIINDAEGRASVPVDAIAVALKYKATSSSFMQAVGALKQFGLLDDQGQGERRKVRVSDLAFDLILHKDDPQARRRLLQDAALRPSIHRELWDHWDGQLPSDAALRIYLLRDREEGVFNQAAVGPFIAQFRETLAYAGLGNGDIMDDADSAGKEPDGDKKPTVERPKIGDRIQWTVNGAEQFPTPLAVRGYAGDNHLWVEGVNTGVPVSQATVIDKAPPQGVQPPPVEQPPVGNPFLTPPPAAGAAAVYTGPLPGGGTFELRLSKPATPKRFKGVSQVLGVYAATLELADDDEPDGE